MTVDFFQVELEPSFSLIIPLERTAEVLSLQWAELCPIPGINAALLGISNQRGRLLWMVDIAALLGLTTVERVINNPEKSTAIVFTKDELRVAGVVARLKGIATLDHQRIQAHPHPCLQGRIMFEAERLHVLDGDSVFEALQVHQLIASPMVLTPT